MMPHPVGGDRDQLTSTAMSAPRGLANPVGRPAPRWFALFLRLRAAKRAAHDRQIERLPSGLR